MDPLRTTPQFGFGMTAAAMQGMARAYGFDGPFPGAPGAMPPWGSVPFASPDATPWDSVQIAPPGPGATEGDLADFLDRMRRMKQEALQERARTAPTRPTDPDRAGTRTGPLEARAHGFHKGDEFVPVRSIRIFEVGNYRKRSLGTFNGNWYEPGYTHRMDSARVGKDYRVVVTWADGSSQERDLRMDSPEGASVDIWKY